jgi:hypothetical protein
MAEHNKDRGSQREGRGGLNSKVSKLTFLCPLF